MAFTPWTLLIAVAVVAYELAGRMLLLLSIPVYIVVSGYQAGVTIVAPIPGMWASVNQACVALGGGLRQFFSMLSGVSIVFAHVFGAQSTTQGLVPRDAVDLAARAGASYTRLLTVGIAVLLVTGPFGSPRLAADLWDITIPFLHDCNCWIVNVWHLFLFQLYAPANDVYSSLATIWNNVIALLPDPVGLLTTAFRQFMHALQLFVRATSGNWGFCPCLPPVCPAIGSSTSCLPVDARCFMSDMWATGTWVLERILAEPLGATTAASAIQFLNALSNAYLASVQALLPARGCYLLPPPPIEDRIADMVAAIDAIYQTLGSDLISVVIAFITNLPGIRDLINLVYSIPALIVGVFNFAKNLFLSQFGALINEIMGFVLNPWRVLCGAIGDIPFVGEELASLPYCSLTNTIRTAADLFPDIIVPDIPTVPGLPAPAPARRLLGSVGPESAASLRSRPPVWDDYVAHARNHDAFEPGHVCVQVLLDAHRTRATESCMLRANTRAAVAAMPAATTAVERSMHEIMLQNASSLAPGEPDANAACHAALADLHTTLFLGDYATHVRTIHCVIAHVATARARDALANRTWIPPGVPETIVPHFGADIGAPHGEAGVTSTLFALGLRYGMRHHCTRGETLHRLGLCTEDGAGMPDHVHADSAPPKPAVAVADRRAPGEHFIYHMLTPRSVDHLHILVAPGPSVAGGEVHGPHPPFAWQTPEGRAPPPSTTRARVAAQPPVRAKYVSPAVPPGQVAPQRRRHLLQSVGTADGSLRMFGTLEDDYYDAVSELGDGILGALSTRILTVVPQYITYATSLDINRPSIGADLYAYIRCGTVPPGPNQWGLLCAAYGYLPASLPILRPLNVRMQLTLRMYPTGGSTSISPVYLNYQHRFLYSNTPLYCHPSDKATRCDVFLPSGAHEIAYLLEYGLQEVSVLVSYVRPNTDMHLHELVDLLGVTIYPNTPYLSLAPLYPGAPWWLCIRPVVQRSLATRQRLGMRDVELLSPFVRFLTLFDPAADGHTDFDSVPGVCALVMSGAVPVALALAVGYASLILYGVVFAGTAAGNILPIIILVFSPMASVTSFALAFKSGSQLAAMEVRMQHVESRGKV